PPSKDLDFNCVCRSLANRTAGWRVGIRPLHDLLQLIRGRVFRANLNVSSKPKSPAETLSSVPSSPRLSDSLETETSNDVSVTPTWAARIAITVAWHDASEALRSQPGFGAEPPPPRADGISVDSFSPCGPVTWNFTPFSSTAVAEGFLDRAFVGCSAKTLDSFSIASRTEVIAKASSSGTFKTEAHRERRCVVAAVEALNGCLDIFTPRVEIDATVDIGQSSPKG